MTAKRDGKSRAVAGKGKGIIPAPGVRRGLPDPASIVSEKSFVSPDGRRYRIIRTDERDPYDQQAVKPKGH